MDDLPHVGVQVKAVDSGNGLQFLWRAGRLRALLIGGPRLPEQGIVPQFVQVFVHLGVFRIQFERMSQSRARGRRVAAQPVLGRGLHQCGYRVTAGHVRRQRVVLVAWVQLGGLFIALHGFFKLLIDEELAGRNVELRRPPPVGVARRFGRLDLRRIRRACRSCGRGRLLGRSAP